MRPAHEDPPTGSAPATPGPGPHDPSATDGGCDQPRLRGHHLICLQFFHGQGYDQEFVHNLFRTIERLTASAGRVVVGPDDVCRACPSLVDDRCSREPEGEDEIRILDALALELLGLRPGDDFDYGETSVWVPRILDRWVALACDGCEWADICAPQITLSARFPPEY